MVLVFAVACAALTLIVMGIGKALKFMVRPVISMIRSGFAYLARQIRNLPWKAIKNTLGYIVATALVLFIFGLYSLYLWKLNIVMDGFVMGSLIFAGILGVISLGVMLVVKRSLREDLQLSVGLTGALFVLFTLLPLATP